MNNYQFNKKEILQKAKHKYHKEKAAEYYLKNKEAIKEKSKKLQKNCKKKEKLESIKEKNIKNQSSIKRKHYNPNKFYFVKYKNVFKIWWY